MFTQQHYIVIAERLRYQKGLAASPAGEAIVWAVAKDLAEVFATDNPRFNHDRFMVAAGFEA